MVIRLPLGSGPGVLQNVNVLCPAHGIRCLSFLGCLSWKLFHTGSKHPMITNIVTE